MWRGCFIESLNPPQGCIKSTLLLILLTRTVQVMTSSLLLMKSVKVVLPDLLDAPAPTKHSAKYRKKRHEALMKVCQQKCWPSVPNEFSKPLEFL